MSRGAVELVEEFEVDGPVAPALPADYNVAPTKPVYAVLERLEGDSEQRRRLAVVRWGLVPSWAKDPSVGSRMVNARLETAAEKPSFRAAYARRRCIVPADGYYEWQVTHGASGTTKAPKQPWFIHPGDGHVLGMAGLYEGWRDRTRDDDDPAAWLWTVTVLTTEATGDLAQIHDRTPLLVPHDHRSAWLDPADHDPTPLIPLLRKASEGLVLTPVSTAVNSVRNNGPELLLPVTLDAGE